VVASASTEGNAKRFGCLAILMSSRPQIRVVGEECGWCGGAVVGSVPLSIAAGCFFVNVQLTSRE